MMHGTRRIPSLGDHISSLCHKNRHVAHKYTSRSQKGRKHEVFGSHGSSLLSSPNTRLAVVLLALNTPNEYFLVARDAKTLIPFAWPGYARTT